MSQRERLLGGLVGALVLMGALLYFGDMYLDEHSNRMSNIAAKKGERLKQEEDVALGLRAAEELAEFEDVALPWDGELAQRLYQAWLLDVLDKQVGFQSADVATGVPKIDKFFMTHQFTVTCKGDVEQLTKFLHSFYSADILHYFDSINIRQMRESRDLSLTFNVRAVALPNSPERVKLTPKPADYRNLAQVDDYIRSIAYRNPFGFKNNGPKISLSSTRIRLPLNESLTLSPSATDSDKGDKVRFHADLEELPNARLDENTGRISWKPDELGKRELTIYATDNGFPPTTSAVDVTVEIVEPEKVVETPKPLGFDTAKLAVVSAIIRSRGKPQVWVSVRANGQLLKLGVGDKFEVGRTNAKVTRIEQREFHFETSEGEIKVAELGQNLADAQAVSSGE